MGQRQDAADGVLGTEPAEMVRLARPRSLTALVVEQIRELIVTGKLALGEQLSENVLAERLGVSRTPVREAFVRLEAERLVEVRPQRGTFVFQVDADEVRDICELREILETGALRVAVAHDTAALVAALAGSVEAAAAAEVADAASYQPFDTDFHETLVRASGNRQLIEAYGRIAARVHALRYRFARRLEQVRKAQVQHTDILVQLRAGDMAEAEAMLRHHVYNSYRALLDFVASEGAAHQAREGKG